MCPGLTSPGARMDSVPENSVVVSFSKMAYCECVPCTLSVYYRTVFPLMCDLVFSFNKLNHYLSDVLR